MAKQKTIGMVSLGCPKALVDSENILTRLCAEGYEVIGDYDGADLVVVNTCGFVDAAVEESLDAIGEAIAEHGRVIVTGCLGARENGEWVRRAHPKVLAVTGPHAADEVMRHIHEQLPMPHEPRSDLVPPAGIKLTPDHYAYLKISEGCNHGCTFCIIPALRGELVSRPVGELLAEAEALADSGVRELLLIAQDLSAYGVDQKYRTGFHGGRPVRTRLKELCKELSGLDMWIRLHYVYPYPSVDDLIPLMAEGKILPYLDIPLQHASPNVLNAMKRPANAENALERIRRWREMCPDITLRSTFITGFPGETEDDFNQLLEFIEAAELDRVGVFAYSDVEGAASNHLPGMLSLEVREERKSRLLWVQEDISARRLARHVGRTKVVLVDEIDEDGIIVARSEGDAPEIDGLVFVEGVESDEVQPGDFLEVTVFDSDTHDLFARVE